MFCFSYIDVYEGFIAFFLCERSELRFHIILVFLWLSELYLYTLVMCLLYIYFDDCSSYMRRKKPSASLAPVLPFRFSNLRYDVMGKNIGGISSSAHAYVVAEAESTLAWKQRI